MKRLLLSLLFSSILLIAAGAVLIHFDLEGRYFADAAAVSEQWEQQLRKESSGPLIIFCGGSEVRTCIDPEAFWSKYQLRVVNAGQHAGFGLVCNVIAALPCLRAGDTLAVSLLSPTQDCDQLPLMGLRFLWRREGVRGFVSPLFPLSAGNLLKSVRFNQQTDWTYLRKLRQGDFSHHYDKNAKLHHPSGWMEILLKKNLSASGKSAAMKEGDFSSCLDFMQRLKTWCDAHSVHLVCFVPWKYVGSAEEARFIQRENARYALMLNQHGIPVLKDMRLGCVADPDFFSDTTLHQNRQGIEAYTDTLAPALLSGSFWQQEELQSLLRAN